MREGEEGCERGGTGGRRGRECVRGCDMWKRDMVE